MARLPGARYVTGTASEMGVRLPRNESAGGLLILLLGAYLLLAFATGRLGWLTNTINDVMNAYNAGSSPPSTGAGYVPPAAPTPPPWQYAGYPYGARPRTFPVYG